MFNRAEEVKLEKTSNIILILLTGSSLVFSYTNENSNKFIKENSEKFMARKLKKYLDVKQYYVRIGKCFISTWNQNYNDQKIF